MKTQSGRFASLVYDRSLQQKNDIKRRHFSNCSCAVNIFGLLNKNETSLLQRKTYLVRIGVIWKAGEIILVIIGPVVMYFYNGSDSIGNGQAFLIVTGIFC